MSKIPPPVQLAKPVVASGAILCDKRSVVAAKERYFDHQTYRLIQIDCSWVGVHGIEGSYTGDGVSGNGYGDGWTYTAEFLTNFRGIALSGMSRAGLRICFNDSWQQEEDNYITVDWEDANLESWLNRYNYGEFLITLVWKSQYDHIPS